MISDRVKQHREQRFNSQYFKDTVPKPLGKDLKYELNEYFFNNQYRFDYYRCCDKEYDYDWETEERFYYHIFYLD
tara:strand:- start:882 stop:1106 length:225 start_codon:yes stop_codon:yes gene_type:complete